MGEIKCMTGIVVRVKQGARGVHFLDFCDDFRLCPFTVVIFPRDLKSVGDVRQLQGRMVEIHGQVKEYDGRAEIILEEYRQLERRRRQNSSAAQKLRRGEKRPLQRRNLQPSQSQSERPRNDNRPKWSPRRRKIRSIVRQQSSAGVPPAR